MKKQVCCFNNHISIDLFTWANMVYNQKQYSWAGRKKIVVSNLDLSNLEAGIYTGGECSLSPVKVVVEVYVKDKTIKRY